MREGSDARESLIAVVSFVQELPRLPVNSGCIITFTPDASGISCARSSDMVAGTTCIHDSDHTHSHPVFVRTRVSRAPTDISCETILGTTSITVNDSIVFSDDQISW